MSLTATPLASLPPAPQLMPGGRAVAPSTPPSPNTSAQPGGRPGNDTDPSASDNGRQGVANRDGRGSAAEQRMLADLKARDREVRNHENAHRAAGGDLVRGGSYDYQQGPDGKRYAVGGDVQIDTSPVPEDPAATAEKMSRVIGAALAPAQPSSTDLAVAAQAAAERNRALVEARREATGFAGEAEERAGEPADRVSAAYRQVAEHPESDSMGIRAEA